MSQHEQIRCTNCGEEFIYPDINTQIIRCPRCKTHIFITQAKLFINIEIDSAHDIKTLRKLLHEAIYKKDARLIRDQANMIRILIPDDYMAIFSEALSLKMNGDPRNYEDLLRNTSKDSITNEMRDEVLEIILQNYDRHNRKAIENFITQNYPHRNQHKQLSRLQRAINMEKAKINKQETTVPRDVFICNSSTDKEIAMEVYQYLTKAGFDCWITYENLREDSPNYWDDITEAIRASTVFLVIKSDDCMYRPDPQKEIRFAKKLNKKRVEYRIDVAGHTALFHDFFDGLPWVDGIKHGNEALEKLGKVVSKRIDQSTHEQANRRIWKRITILASCLTILTAIVYFGQLLISKKQSSTLTSVSSYSPLETTTKDNQEVASIQDQIENLVDLKVGDVVYWGRYEQDNNRSNGAESIQWKVLAIDDTKALLISMNNLEYLPYNITNEPITWENCSLRKWLNDEFIALAFSEQEASAIITATIKSVIENGLSSGNDTKDRVFILSNDEVTQYILDKQERAAENSAYVDALAADSYSYENGWWWTRSPGYSQVEEDRVAEDGTIYGNGFSVVDDYNSVRPAFWIDLNNPYMNSIGDLTLPNDTLAEHINSSTISDSLKKDIVTQGNLRFQQKGDGYSVIYSIDQQATAITIPSEVDGIPVTEIGDGAFYKMLNLREIYISDSVISIKSNAFSGCTQLSSIRFSKNLQILGDSVFDNCTNLSELFLPASLKYICDHTFYQCTGLTSFFVAEGNTEFSAEDGVLYNISKTELIRYPASKKAITYTMPDSVMKIDYFAFAYTKFLNKIEFPNHDFSLGFCVFCGSEAITEITFPEGFEGSSYNYMFEDCKNLVRVSFPSSLIFLGNSWFLGCDNLQVIDIPSKNRYFHSEDGVLYSWEMSELVFYPPGKLDLTYSIPSTVTKIEYRALAGVVHLEDIYIGDNVATIEYEIFNGDESVTIHCSQGSAAHNYAIDNKMDYQLE